MKKKAEEKITDESISRRLDALIRIFIETKNSTEKLTDANIARILQSVGLKPTEIARIMGKKSATDVSQYLYKKKTA